MTKETEQEDLGFKIIEMIMAEHLNYFETLGILETLKIHIKDTLECNFDKTKLDGKLMIKIYGK